MNFGGFNTNIESGNRSGSPENGSASRGEVNSAGNSGLEGASGRKEVNFNESRNEGTASNKLENNNNQIEVKFDKDFGEKNDGKDSKNGGDRIEVTIPDQENPEIDKKTVEGNKDSTESDKETSGLDSVEGRQEGNSDESHNEGNANSKLENSNNQVEVKFETDFEEKNDGNDSNNGDGRIEITFPDQENSETGKETIETDKDTTETKESTGENKNEGTNDNNVEGSSSDNNAEGTADGNNNAEGTTAGNNNAEGTSSDNNAEGTNGDNNAEGTNGDNNAEGTNGDNNAEGTNGDNNAEGTNGENNTEGTNGDATDESSEDDTGRKKLETDLENAEKNSKIDKVQETEEPGSDKESKEELEKEAEEAAKKEEQKETTEQAIEAQMLRMQQLRMSREEALDGKNSEGYIKECSDIIGQMESQQTEVLSAKEQKFQEILAYVSERNMERYDTERDPYYQHLIEEYRQLIEQEKKAQSAIKTLDSDAIMVSWMQGLPYETAKPVPYDSNAGARQFREQKEREEQTEREEQEHKEEQEISQQEISEDKYTAKKEIAEGTDDPEKTDYFEDVERARECMQKFCQHEWEKLTPEEKQEQIKRLAAYNKEVLGLDDDVEVVFYTKDDGDDFGHYSNKDKVVYINESNLSSGEETADTIAHELRHAYQYMRSEKLECDRDLEFSDNLEHYLDPETAGYKEYLAQCVEKDARAYAERYRAFIRSIGETGETGDAPKTMPDLETGKEIDVRQEGDEVQEEIKPEPKKIKESPEKTEVRDTHEVFTPEEIEEIKTDVRAIYENAHAVAKEDKALEFYKEHYGIDEGHISRVAEKSLEAADHYESLFKNNDYDGLYSPNIDRKTLQMMAYYHDTGMDGGIPASEYDGARDQFIKEHQGEASAEELGDAFDENVRKNHSLQSAIHVLEHREEIEEKDVDPDVVAIGCFMHSKSCSGMKNLADGAEVWAASLEKIQAAVDEYNKSNPESPISFNKNCFMNEDGSVNEEKLAQLRSYCACLRVGDAFGHDCRSVETQGGKTIEIDKESMRVDVEETREKVKDEIEKQEQEGEKKSKEEREKDKAKRKEFYHEVQSMDIEVDGQKLDNENDPKGISRMFAAGEGNFKELKTDHIEGNDKVVVLHEITLVDGNDAVYCTQECITERVKEMATICSKTTDEQDKINKKSGKSTLNLVGMKMVVHVGEKCDKTVVEEYQNYAREVKAMYNIEVEILP